MTPEQLRAEAEAAERLAEAAERDRDKRWLAAKARELRHQASRLEKRSGLPWRRHDPQDGSPG